ALTAGEAAFSMDDVLARVDVPRRRFTADEYYRMGEAGVFGPDERVELIDGEIITMAPIGNRHAACVARLTRALSRPLRARALTRDVGEVFRRPARESYEVDTHVERGNTLTIAAFPDVALAVDDILPAA